MDVVSSKLVLIAGYFWRTPFRHKSNISLLGALLRVHIVKLRLITLSLVADDLDQLRIASHSGAHLWIQIMLRFVFAFLHLITPAQKALTLRS